MTQLVTASTLKELVAAKGVKEVRVSGDAGGYRVSVSYGGQHREIASRTREGKNKPRTFRTLDTAARYLREFGLVRYQVDDSRFAPSTVKRPDRAAALKKTHEAAGYDAHFRAQVAEGIAQLDAGQGISHKDMKTWMAERRAALQKQIVAVVES